MTTKRIKQMFSFVIHNPRSLTSLSSNSYLENSKYKHHSKLRYLTFFINAISSSV